jgi:hypothetical protein
MWSKHFSCEIAKSLPINTKHSSAVQFAMIGHGERLSGAVGKDKIAKIFTTSPPERALGFGMLSRFEFEFVAS